MGAGDEARANRLDDRRARGNGPPHCLGLMASRVEGLIVDHERHPGPREDRLELEAEGGRQLALVRLEEGTVAVEFIQQADAALGQRQPR
jgi:hypothetical protein